MGQGKLHLEIWPLFSASEAYEIACIKFDNTGSPFIYGTIGPYLTKQEAEADLPNITENSFKKKEKKF